MGLGASASSPILLKARKASDRVPDLGQRSGMSPEAYCERL